MPGSVSPLRRGDRLRRRPERGSRGGGGCGEWWCWGLLRFFHFKAVVLLLFILRMFSCDTRLQVAVYIYIHTHGLRWYRAICCAGRPEASQTRREGAPGRIVCVFL